MRFWEDMQTKYGFGDGDAMPDGIEIYRTIYIRAVNRLAAELGSGVRVAAYDRNGLHNWCLIVMYQLVDLQSNPDQDLTQHTELSVEVVAPDEFIQEAIRQAYELNLDSFVRVLVEMEDGFDEFLSNLYPIGEGDPLVSEVNGQRQHIYTGGRVRLIHDVRSHAGEVLAAGSDYIVDWIDQVPRLMGLTTQVGQPSFVIVSADDVIVLKIPSESCAGSDNTKAIPPFHLRDLDDKQLDEYSAFYNWVDAESAMRRAVRELGKSVQIVNGYGNTVTSLDIGDIVD